MASGKGMVVITSPLLQPNEIAGKTYKIQK